MPIFSFQTVEDLGISGQLDAFYTQITLTHTSSFKSRETIMEWGTGPFLPANEESHWGHGLPQHSVSFYARAMPGQVLLSQVFLPHFGNRKLTVELTVSSYCFGWTENLNQVVSLIIASNQDFIHFLFVLFSLNLDFLLKLFLNLPYFLLFVCL